MMSGTSPSRELSKLSVATLVVLGGLLLAACGGSPRATEPIDSVEIAAMDPMCLNGPGRYVSEFAARVDERPAEEALRQELNAWIVSADFEDMAPEVCVVGLSFGLGISGSPRLSVMVAGNPDDVRSIVEAHAPGGVAVSVEPQPMQTPLPRAPIEIESSAEGCG